MKKDVGPIKNEKKDPETQDAKKASTTRDRVGFRIPPQLKERLYEEASKTGRSVTDIVVAQLWKRYEN
jgi:predicted DNA-binding protein